LCRRAAQAPPLPRPRLDPALLGQGPEVEAAGDEHHELTRVLVGPARGLHALRLRARFLQALEVELLGQEQAGVENVEWPHHGVVDAGKAAEAERLQAELLAHGGEAAADVREHVPERLLPHALRRAHALLGQDQREVAAERAIDGVGEGKGKRTGRGLSGGHATEEGPLGALQAQAGSGRGLRRERRKAT
jgi:hypothetical protein